MDWTAATKTATKTALLSLVQFIQSKEKLLLEARNKALLRKANIASGIIVELKEGGKILEDQLKLMDEKYLELRQKLDYMRRKKMSSSAGAY